MLKKKFSSFEEASNYARNYAKENHVGAKIEREGIFRIVVINESDEKEKTDKILASEYHEITSRTGSEGVTWYSVCQRCGMVGINNCMCIKRT